MAVHTFSDSYQLQFWAPWVRTRCVVLALRKFLTHRFGGNPPRVKLQHLPLAPTSFLKVDDQRPQILQANLALAGVHLRAELIHIVFRESGQSLMAVMVLWRT